MTDHTVNEYSEWFLNKNELMPLIASNTDDVNHFCCWFFNKSIMDELVHDNIVEEWGDCYMYNGKEIYDPIPVIIDMLEDEGRFACTDEEWGFPDRMPQLLAYAEQNSDTTLFTTYVIDENNKSLETTHGCGHVCNMFNELFEICKKHTLDNWEINIRHSLIKDVMSKLKEYLDENCVMKGDKADLIREEFFIYDVEHIEPNLLMDDDFFQKYLDLSEALGFDIDMDDYV